MPWPLRGAVVVGAGWAGLLDVGAGTVADGPGGLLLGGAGSVRATVVRAPGWPPVVHPASSAAAAIAVAISTARRTLWAKITQPTIGGPPRIETFAGWLRPDGLPLDPWLRTHVRVGGHILTTAPNSQTMTGTVEQWETWTGLQLPATGHYVIPGGLSPLYIDREADVGTYTEPNIWIQHR